MPGRRTAALTLAALGVPTTAFAHHAMGGAAPTAIWEGAVAGIAHPVIGLDHLAFLLAAGLLASVTSRRVGISAILAFLAAGAGGALLHLGGIGLGAGETFVALSVLLAGAALLAGQGLLAAAAPAGLALAFAAAGIVHGHALAESVAGSPPGVVAAYLATLIVSQGAIALAAMAVATRWRSFEGAARRYRFAGIGATAFGAVILGMSLLA
jgi:urease accessory protein